MVNFTVKFDSLPSGRLDFAERGLERLSERYPSVLALRCRFVPLANLRIEALGP